MSEQGNMELLFRRFGAGLVDAAIEIVGGVLGCYFGALAAALFTALKYQDLPMLQSEMQDSIWVGLGYGFAFWMLSVSFVNCVLIQGLSRASLGKKLFKLELVAVRGAYTWKLMLTRWVLSQASLLTLGMGYFVMFFNKAHRTLHDLILETDVLPHMQANSILAVTYQQESVVSQADESYPALPLIPLANRIVIMTSDVSERPMATVIQLPVPYRDQNTANYTKLTLAEVVTLDRKKAA